MRWSAIAVTAPTQEAANEICSTLPSALQESAVLLAVPDATSGEAEFARGRRRNDYL